MNSNRAFCRDRIIHLLAVQSYQRPELLLRLKRDGLTDEQKDKVSGLLTKVGRTGRQGEYYLSPTFFNLVEPNWPGYSPSERSTVASLKVRCSVASQFCLTMRCFATQTRENIAHSAHELF